MSDFIHLWRLILGVFFVFSVIFCLLVGGGYQMDKAVCNATWKDSGYATDYGFFSRCRIEIQGKWIPADSLRSIKEAQQ